MRRTADWAFLVLVLVLVVVLDPAGLWKAGVEDENEVADDGRKAAPCSPSARMGLEDEGGG